MIRVKLIHWKLEEVEQREKILHAAGYEVDSKLVGGSKIFKEFTDNPPAAIVIDLSRLPSQGRDFGLMVRKRKVSRNVPLVFVEGDPAKVEQIKGLLPDAEYTTWDNIGQTLEHAIANPPQDPVYHESTFAGYAGKSLVEKLGIKTGMTICLVNSPESFNLTLGELPAGAEIVEERTEACDLTFWFCRSQKDLANQIPDIVAQAGSGPVWIAWPKKKSDYTSDLSQQSVRQIGEENKLVDYKISAFDETWSGLLFKFKEKQ